MEILLKYSRNKNVDLFKRVVDLVDKLGDQVVSYLSDQSELGPDYWQTVVIYLLEHIDEKKYSQEKVVYFFAQILNKPQEVFMSIAQKLRHEGWQQGKHEGWQQGKHEGWQQGKHEGWQQGKHEGMQQVAKSMLLNHVDRSLIVKITGLREQDLEQLV